MGNCHGNDLDPHLVEPSSRKRYIVTWVKLILKRNITGNQSDVVRLYGVSAGNLHLLLNGFLSYAKWYAQLCEIRPSIGPYQCEKD